MSDNSDNLGLKIKQMRKAKGWTQEQLAERIGIDNKHLSRIEKGYHMPNYQIIKKLAQIFNFDIRNFEDITIDDINLPDKITLKSMQILNSAVCEKEKTYYLEALQHAQKGLKLGKNLTCENCL
jgi:transcriptional regulator with XRE-family HTH domain